MSKMLWIGHVLAAIAMRIAADINTESILVTGPALSAIGLLLGLATIALQSPLVLAFALSGPLVCGLISSLIAVYRWSPPEAHNPILMVLNTYLLLIAPVAVMAGYRVWQWKITAAGTTPEAPPFQFRLRTLMILMTATCILIGIGKIVIADFRGERPIFGGYTLLTITLSGLVLWRHQRYPTVFTETREERGEPG